MQHNVTVVKLAERLEPFFHFREAPLGGGSNPEHVSQFLVQDFIPAIESLSDFEQFVVVHHGGAVNNAHR